MDGSELCSHRNTKKTDIPENGYFVHKSLPLFVISRLCDALLCQTLIRKRLVLLSVTECRPELENCLCNTHSGFWNPLHFGH